MMQKTSDIYESIETIFIKANGIDIEVDTQGNGDKLVLCLHGWPEHSIAWRFQIPTWPIWVTKSGHQTFVAMAIPMRQAA